MVVDYFSSEDWCNTKLFEIQDKIENQIISSMVKEWDEYSCQLESIEIETVNRCNNDCSFCPANYKADKREPAFMDEKLFYKIIDDLKQMKYKGMISLFSNNEPLIDKRITKFVKYVDKNLPEARSALYTNGLLLTQEIYESLIGHLDYLIIDNYNDDMALIDSVKCVYDHEYKVTDTNKCKTKIMVRKKNQILLSRGGLAPNKHIAEKYFSPCLLPFLQMVVRPDGKINRCCEDVYGDTILGDLNISSVKEAWNGKEYIQLRREMKNGNRSGLPYCCDCDQVGLKNYFPAKWLYDYSLKFVEIIKKKYDEGLNIAIVNFKHSAEFIYLLKFFGINRVIVANDISGYEDHYLIFGSYQAVELYHLREEDANEKFIIFDESYLGSSSDRYIKSKYVSEDFRKHPLILFGTGCYARAIMKSYNIQPVLVVDNDPQKIGTQFENMQIESPEKIKEHLGNCKVIVAIGDSISVRGQLFNMGVFDSDIILAEELL